MNKKILSIILVVALCLSVIPVTGLAVTKRGLAERMKDFVSDQIASATDEQKAAIADAKALLDTKDGDAAFWKSVADLFVTDQIKANDKIWKWKVVFNAANSGITVTGDTAIEADVTTWTTNAAQFIADYNLEGKTITEAQNLFDGYNTASSDLLNSLKNIYDAAKVAKANAPESVDFTGFDEVAAVYSDDAAVASAAKAEIVTSVAALAAENGADALFTLLSGGDVSIDTIPVSDETAKAAFLILGKDLVNIVLDSQFLEDAYNVLNSNKTDILDARALLQLIAPDDKDAFINTMYTLLGEAFGIVYNASFADAFKNAIAANGWDENTLATVINTAMGMVDDTRAMEMIHANIFIGKHLVFKNAPDGTTPAVTEIAAGESKSYYIFLNVNDVEAQITDHLTAVVDASAVEGATGEIDSTVIPAPVFRVTMPATAIAQSAVNVEWYSLHTESTLTYLTANSFKVSGAANPVIKDVEAEIGDDNKVSVKATLEDLESAKIIIRDDEGNIIFESDREYTKAELEAGVIIDVPGIEDGIFTISLKSGVVETTPIILTTYAITLDTPVDGASFEIGNDIVVKGTTNMKDIIVGVENGAGDKVVYVTIAKEAFEAGYTLPALGEGNYTLWAGITGKAVSASFAVTLPTTPYTIAIDTPAASAEYTLGDAIVLKGTTDMPNVVVGVENGAGDKVIYETITKAEFEAGYTLPALTVGSYTLWAGINGTAGVANDSVAFTVIQGTANYTIDITSPAADAQYNVGDTVTVQGTTNMPVVVVALSDAFGVKVMYETITKAEFEAGYNLPALAEGTYTMWAGISGTEGVANKSVTFTINPILPAYSIALDSLNASYNLGEAITIKGTTNMPAINVALSKGVEKVLHQTITKAEYEAGYVLPALAEGSYTIYVGVNGEAGVMNQTAAFTVVNPLAPAISGVAVAPASVVKGGNVTVTATLANLDNAKVYVMQGDVEKLVSEDFTAAQFATGAVIPTATLDAGEYTVNVKNGAVAGTAVALTVTPIAVTPAISGVVLDPASVVKGGEVKVTATLTALDNAKIYVMQSGLEKLVSEDFTAAQFATGAVISIATLAAGEYTVYVKNGDVTSEAANLTVTPLAGDIDVKLATDKKTIKVDQSFTLKATITLPEGVTKDMLADPEWTMSVLDSTTKATSYVKLTSISGYEKSGDKLTATVKVTAKKKTTSNKPVVIALSVATENNTYFDEASMELTIKAATSGGSGSGSSSNNNNIGIVIDNDTEKSPFSDVPTNHWAYSTIKAMSKNNLLVGYPDGTFKPEGYITRAEFATVASRILGLEILTSGVIYDDTANHWARDIIGTMSLPQGLGMLRGIGENKFAPDVYITREQAAAIIVRAKSSVWQKTKNASDAFGDAASVSPWFTEDIDVAYSNGLITGFEDGTYRPQASTTRAEACALLLRAWPEYLTK